MTNLVRGHAFYAPSSAYEWVECAPSVLVDVGDFDDESDASQRGSFLHACGEMKLHTGSYSFAAVREKTGIDYHPETEKQAEKDHASVQTYVEYVQSRGGVGYIERMSWFIKGLSGGTTDVAIFHEDDHHLEVIDYKAGRIRRRARANYQIILYGLGILRKFSRLYDVRKVTLTIVQPEHMDEGVPDSWTLTVKELERWGQRIRARVEFLEGLRGKGEIGDYNPSKERCQFCIVGKAGKCEELDRAALAASIDDFKDYQRPGKPVTDAEKWDIAERAEKWIDNFRERITKSVLGGTPIEGFKQVAGQGRYHVTDKAGFVEHLVKEGFGETDIYVGEPALVSLNQAKGLYSGRGAGANRDALLPFFEKQPGPTRVVPVSDKRLAINTEEQSKKDFEGFKREKKEKA